MTRTAYRTPHTARRIQAARYPGDPERWRVSWLPEQLLTKAEATMAMSIAEVLANGTPEFGGTRWVRIGRLASYLNLTVQRAIDLVATPPHLLDRRFHTMTLGCWCKPRPTLDGAVHTDPAGEPVFAATDNDPITADGYAYEDHR